jgi:shikimate kinase
LDALIERRARLAVPEIFARKGEASFRVLETRCLTGLRPSRLVVATGGGAVLRAGNRAWMGRHGVMVRLRIGAADVRKRLTKAQISARPLLRNGGLKAWNALARKRAKYYALAPISVDARPAPQLVAASIIVEIKKKKPNVLADKTLR